MCYKINLLAQGLFSGQKPAIVARQRVYVEPLCYHKPKEKKEEEHETDYF